MAPTKHTTEPTERSILPPVRIANNIPVARTYTYAFCAIRLAMFCGINNLPPVDTEKNMITSTRARIIVYFFIKSATFAFSIVTSPFLI